MQDWMRDILERPTASVKDTARVLGIGKNQAYEAAKAGKIPTLTFGKGNKRVATSWIKQTLGLSGDAA